MYMYIDIVYTTGSMASWQCARVILTIHTLGEGRRWRSVVLGEGEGGSGGRGGGILHESVQQPETV